MGKRKKSTRKPVKRIVQKLDTKFNCLFCNHDKSVTCTLDKKNSIGSLSCKICGQSFQTRINSLSQPVDVYSDWFDAVEEVNQGRGSDSENDDGSSSDYETDSDEEGDAGRGRMRSGGARFSGRTVGADGDEDEDDDDEAEYDDERIGSAQKNAGTVVDSDDDE